MADQQSEAPKIPEHGVLGEDALSSVASVLRGYPFVCAAYQFGSTVRGKAGSLSDLDLALLVDDTAPVGPEKARTEGLLAYRIRQALGEGAPEVDVLTLNGRSVVFQHEVLRTGRLIYDGDPQARRRFVWQVVQAYLDFEPTLRWMRRFQKEGWLRRCGLR